MEVGPIADNQTNVVIAELMTRTGERVKRRGKVRHRPRKSGKPDKFRFDPRDY